MADGFVCVGGVDVDNRRSVRLLDARGRHETAETCPYTIWDIWDIDYYPNQRRPNPHTEDVNVTRRIKIDRVDAPNMSVKRFAELMLRICQSTDSLLSLKVRVSRFSAARCFRFSTAN